MLQILEQVQKKYSLVPNSDGCSTKGREEHLNHVHAVHNGVGTAASAERVAVRSADGGRENHTRLWLLSRSSSYVLTRDVSTGKWCIGQTGEWERFLSYGGDLFTFLWILLKYPWLTITFTRFVEAIFSLIEIASSHWKGSVTAVTGWAQGNRAFFYSLEVDAFGLGQRITWNII